MQRIAVFAGSDEGKSVQFLPGESFTVHIKVYPSNAHIESVEWSVFWGFNDYNRDCDSYLTLQSSDALSALALAQSKIPASKA